MDTSYTQHEYFSGYARSEHKRRQASFPNGRSVLSGRPRQRQLGPGDGALDEDLAAEAIELGRAAAGLDRDRAGLLDEALLIDEAPEILFVEPPPGECLDGTLQLQEGKGGRHQVEDDGPILDLVAQRRYPGGENAAVVIAAHQARR